MRTASWAVVSVAVVVVAAAGSGCNRRVFKQTAQTCDSTIPVDLEIPTQKAADILIVVDNSGSMQEEQDKLVANFLNLNVDADGNFECPLGDALADIPDDFRNPPEELYTGDGPLAQCGFIQLLAAFENDFRVGVITTDVGLSDNRGPQASGACIGSTQGEGGVDGTCVFPAGVDGPAGVTCNNLSQPVGARVPTPCPNPWGFRPQRGCLQPDGAPGTPGLQKLIRAEDLRDDDVENDRFAERFGATLANIRTFGSPYERGLDAVQVFLDSEATRGPGCDGDLASFRRDDAQLVVIFLTDEEDCSHGLGGSFVDELAGEPPPGVFQDMFGANNEPKACYESEGTLSPVDAYVTALKAVDPRAKVAVIGGLVRLDDEDDGFVGDGCLFDADDAPQACWPSGGQSNARQPGGACSDAPADPDVVAARNGLPCCVADPSDRYLEFATSFVEDGTTSFLLDSICKQSFRDTMLRTAAFIAATNRIELVEEPAGGVIAVDVNGSTVKRLDDPALCASESGFYLSGKVVTFCGDSVPGPGDDVAIRAKGTADTEECRAQQQEGDDAG